jgi:hypothetical protein
MKFVYIDEEGNPIPLGEKARIRIQKILDAENKVAVLVGK